MDVGVDGECRNAECLSHNNAGRLVTDSGQRLEEIPIGNHLASTLQNLFCHPLQVSRLGRREADFADDPENFFNLQRSHSGRRISSSEQRRSDLIHLLVSGLR